MGKTLLDAIRDMEKKAKRTAGYSDEEIKNYIREEKQMRGIGPLSEKSQKLSEYISELMLRDPRNQPLLKKKLRTAARIEKNKMNALREAAQRKGIDKLKNDFWGKKKRAAKEAIREIEQDRRKNGGTQVEDIDTASISTGRGRGLLSPFVNAQAMGTKENRHKKMLMEGNPIPRDQLDRWTNHEWEEVDYDEELVMDPYDKFTCKTDKGELDGLKFEPTNGKKSGKVVLFFSGSGDNAFNYVGPVANTYLNEGTEVYVMNYRGFGDSKTLKKNGEQDKTPLSEQSIYEDGRAMFDFLVNEKKIDPCNIILHGFSMGGAVASKVAADVSMEQAKRRQEAVDRRQPLSQQEIDKNKLGGLVLHSPMASMYEAAGKGVLGFAGWMSGGGFNTRSHMRRLHKFDPNLPVFYASGRKPDDMKHMFNCDDQLSLEVTNIHQDPEAQFKNSAVYVDHEQGHVGRVFSDFKRSNETKASNYSECRKAVHELVTKGREASLAPNVRKRENNMSLGNGN